MIDTETTAHSTQGEEHYVLIAHILCGFFILQKITKLHFQKLGYCHGCKFLFGAVCNYR